MGKTKQEGGRRYHKLLTVISLFSYSAFCFAYVGYMINSVGIRGIFQKTLSVENFDFYVAMAFLVGFFGMVLAILGIGALLQTPSIDIGCEKTGSRGEKQ